VNRSRPFSITFHHDLAAIVGLSLLLVATVYLLSLPTLRIILGAPETSTVMARTASQRVQRRFTWESVVQRVFAGYLSII